MFASQVEYSAHTFENLTDLGLSLKHPDLLEGTIQFPLRLLAPTLQILRIADWSGAFDLFALFNTPDSSVPFPNLKSLILDFADPTTDLLPIPSLQSFYGFILAHSCRLEHLHMDLTTSFYPVHVQCVGEWLDELVNTNIQFPSLQTLLLFPSPSQIGLFSFLTLIQRTVPTLSSLTIPPRYWSSEEVDQLLDVLTEVQVHGIKERQSKLKTLRIHVRHLSVPLLDLLARKLPQLESLTLIILEMQVRFFPIFNSQLCINVLLGFIL